MSEYLELKKQDWNDVVSDETKHMRLSGPEEVAFLSDRDQNRMTLSTLNLIYSTLMCCSCLLPQDTPRNVPRTYGAIWIQGVYSSPLRTHAQRHGISKLSRWDR